MIEVVKTRVEREVEDADVVTLLDAAKISGRSLSAIQTMVSGGYLPWYELDSGGIARIRTQRFTSRKALMKLPPNAAHRRKVKRKL